MDSKDPPVDVTALFRLDGKSALVVGGYGGTGQVTSQMLAQSGASVAIAGRSLEKARELAQQLSGQGARAIGARVDIADRASVEALTNDVVAQLGGLDILVNLASIDIEAKAEEFAEEDWRRLIDINLTGAFWL